MKGGKIKKNKIKEVRNIKTISVRIAQNLENKIEAMKNMLDDLDKKDGHDIPKITTSELIKLLIESGYDSILEMYEKEFNPNELHFKSS